MRDLFRRMIKIKKKEKKKKKSKTPRWNISSGDSKGEEVQISKHEPLQLRST